MLDHRRNTVEAIIDGIGDVSRADRKGRTDEGDKGVEVEIMKHGASWSAGGGEKETIGSGAPPTPASSKKRLARCGSLSDDGDGPGRESNEGSGRGLRRGSGVGSGIRRRFPGRASLSPDDHFGERSRERELVEDRVGSGAGVSGNTGQSPSAHARGGGSRTWSSIDKISKALRSSRRRGFRQVKN